jgi:hypothetical protein
VAGGKCPVPVAATQVRGGRETPLCCGGPKEAMGPVEWAPKSGECPVGGRDEAKWTERAGRGPSRVSLVRVGPGERPCMCGMGYRGLKSVEHKGGVQGVVSEGSGREEIYPWRSPGSSDESLVLALLAEDRILFGYKV